MEKLVAFTVALLSLCQIAVAQPCINGVTTNPNAPKPDSPGQYEKFKKNTYFDWRRQTFKINLENNPFATLESPYWNTRRGSDVFSHLVVSKDYEPSDGWELIKMGFGYAWDASIAPDPNYVKIEKTTDPNGVEILFKIHRNSTTSYPLSKPSLGYFVLYNKYSGKMKFFGSNYQFTGSGSAIQVNVELIEELAKENSEPVQYSASGIFAHYGPYSVALDKPTERQKAYSFGHFPQPTDFFMTDFQTAYDPCTCIYPSALDFSLTKVYEGNINLIADSTTYNADGEATSLLCEPVLNQLTNSQIVEYFSLFGIITDLQNVANFRSGGDQAVLVALDYLGSGIHTHKRYKCKFNPEAPSGYGCRWNPLWMCTIEYCEGVL